MRRSSRARSTASTRKSPVDPDAPSTAAWERALDRRRKRLSGRPSRSRVFGLAGLLKGKMHWLRLQPDLRISVMVKLASALELKPETFLSMILYEQANPPPPPKPSTTSDSSTPKVSPFSRKGVRRRRLAFLTRQVVG